MEGKGQNRREGTFFDPKYNGPTGAKAWPLPLCVVGLPAAAAPFHIKNDAKDAPSGFYRSVMLTVICLKVFRALTRSEAGQASNKAARRIYGHRNVVE
jgi:hypothetical protein